ncbi:hypothetical protein LOK49_LG12G02291 [Camellia lanceoleosa]|uniref:Uncharacterized protein n=1 Tax=Camellia lanceoleosa TaxID=1840588 RepID=A0ACC0FSV0_9ERIC|nr:hypothetical protein LOK49_LG12G02291 [Camellia lanceoleosa]
MSSSVAPPLLVLSLSLSLSLSILLSILSCSSDDTTFKGIDLENPVIDLIPSPLTNYTSSSHDLFSPVSIFGLLGIVVAGAALGYWMVRKFVIAEDGSVDVGIAQFVKWAMRVISTLDTPLAMGALASCLSICFLITFFKWSGPDSTITFGNSIYSANGNPWQGRGRANVRQNRAEFLSRSGMVASRGTLWNSPRRSSGWSDSPVKEVQTFVKLCIFSP